MATIYCDSQAAGANNGTSWEDAYTSLQVALDATSSGDTILSNSTEATPLRPATRAISDRTIITDEGPDSHTWISNGYTATWTDAGGGVFSTALAAKPAQVAYDFKRDDESGTVTGVDLNHATYAPTIDRAIAAFVGITRADLVAWYGFLSENTGTPTTPSAGEWGYSSGTLYINPPGSPPLATVNSLAQYCPDSIDAINLNGSNNQVIATTQMFGLTTLLTPGAGSNSGYSVKLGGQNGRIRGVRGIANGWHSCGHAIAAITSGSRIERCINITHAAEGDSDTANPFVFFSSNNGTGYLADRLISVLVPLLKHDGSPLQTSFNGALGLSHTSVLGAQISDVTWRRCYSLNLTALVASKHSVTVNGVGSFIVANNAPAPSQNTPNSWSHRAEDSEAIGTNALPRSRIVHRRCRLNRLGLGSNSDNISAFTVAGNDFYRLEDSMFWPGRNSHGFWNSGTSSNGWAELSKCLVFVQKTDSRPSILHGHNTPFRIESSALGTIGAAGVVAASNQASSTTGPLVTSNSLNVFGHGMAGSYQDHSNVGAVAAKDWAYWRDGTDGKVTGGSGDADSYRLAVTTSLTEFLPLRHGATVDTGGRFTGYVAHIGRTASNVIIELPDGATMGDQSDFVNNTAKAMSPGDVLILDVKLTKSGTVTITPGIGDPVTLQFDAPTTAESVSAYLAIVRGARQKEILAVILKDAVNASALVTGTPTVDIFNFARESVTDGPKSLTLSDGVYSYEHPTNILTPRQHYYARFSAVIDGESRPLPEMPFIAQ